MQPTPTSEFERRCISMAKHAYLTDPELDGVTLLFAETRSIANNVMWGLEFYTPEQKGQVLVAVQLAMAHRNTQRYAVMSLAWSSGPFVDNPKDAPDREEILMLAIAGLDGTRIMRFWDVVRNEAGAIVDFTHKVDEEADEDGNPGNGAMLSLLDVRGEVPAELGTFANKMLSMFLLSG